jgi:HK97 family phage portal protein
VARIFGVPPHLIADASNSTSWGSGLQEQNLAFGQFSLRPWIERIEDAHGRLLTTHGLPDVFVKLNLDALLRASLKDRYESYAIGIENQFLLRNEARKLEDSPPLPGGDAFPDPSIRWPDPASGAPSSAPNSNGSSA